MNDARKQALTKVPAVTLGFWVIKILATTLGETGGDTVTMTLNWGYVAGVALFGIVLVALVAGQILRQTFPRDPVLGDDRRLDDLRHHSGGFRRSIVGNRLHRRIASASGLPIGDAEGLWRWSEGTVAVSTVSTPKVEAFYWATITFSQTLGTALGDWLADTGGFGYERGAMVFAAGLAIWVIALYYWTGISRVTLFWVAFILTRPFGRNRGRLSSISPSPTASARPEPAAGLSGHRGRVIVVLIVVLPQRPGRHPARKVVPRQERNRQALAIGSQHRAAGKPNP